METESGIPLPFSDAVTFRSCMRTRRAACIHRVHRRCPPRVRRRAENCIIQARRWKPSQARFYFSSPETACKFHEARRRICKDRRRTRSFCTIPARRDSFFSLSAFPSLSFPPHIYFARLANIASRRHELTYVYAENWKYRAVYYREDDVSVPLPYGNSALPIFQGKIGYRCWRAT